MTARSQKLIIRLFAWVPVLVLIGWSIFYLIGQYRHVVNNASVIIVDELSRRLNKEVRVGSATVTPLGVVVLKDLEIASGERLADGYLLEAREVRIKYDARALILDYKGAQSIESVLVIEPKVYLVRRKDGSLNIQDLLKPPKGPPGPPFEGKVEIRHGTVVFTDYLAKVQNPPAGNVFTDVNGTLNAAGQPVYKFVGSANGSKGRFHTVKLVGNYDSKSKVLDMDVDATDVSAAYWSRYLGLSKTLNIESGTLRVIAGVRISKPAGKTKLSLTGAARISDASILLPMMKQPVTGVNGVMALKGQDVILSLTGNLAGSQMRVTGTLSDFQNPKLDILARSASVDFSKLVKSFKAPKGADQIKAGGQGPVSAHITGSAANPNISVTARIPRVTVSGYTARNVRLSATYANGRLTVPSTRFTLDGASVVASGTISTKGEQAISITGEATGIDLRKLPVVDGLQAKGIADVRFQVSGTVSSPNVEATLQIAEGELKGIPVETARARISYGRGKLTVRSLEITSPTAGRVTARGEITRETVDLRVAGEKVDLATVGQLLGLENVTGTGYFAGTIKGPIGNPVFSGTFEAFAAEYETYKIDYARITFASDLQTATVDSGVVRIYPAEFRFTGAASGLRTDRIAFNMSGEVDKLSVGMVSDLLGKKIDATGTIVGRIDAAGIYLKNPEPDQSHLQNTVASAEFRLEDGSAFGYPISKAVAEFNVLDNRLEIGEAILTSQEAVATMGGSVLLDTGALNINISATGFDLSRLRDVIEPYAIVGGVARAEARMMGTVSSPVITAKANIDDLIVNYSRFDLAEVEAVYADGVVQTATAQLKKGSEIAYVQVTEYDPSTNCLQSAEGTLQDINVPNLWNTLRASPYLRSESGAQLRDALATIPKLTNGVLNGIFLLSGCLTDPTGSIHLEARDVGIQARRIDSIVLDASVANGVVQLEELTAAAGETIVTAQGDYKIDKRQIKIDLTASNLELSRLRPWLGDNTPGGTMAADFVIAGDIKSPTITGSIEVVNPDIGGLAFDALRASRIEVKEDRIEFADVILASGSHQVVAYGYLPWSWTDLTIPKDQPIEMIAEMKKQDLSVLSVFVPIVSAGGTSGSVEAVLQVQGTLAEPALGGSLKIENGTVALKNFDNQFDNISVNVSFDGSRIVFNEFSAASSLGGTIGIVPGGYIAIGEGTTPETNLLLVAKGLSIAERDAFGLKEEISTQLDAGISITGDPRAPLIAGANVEGVPGGINIHDTRISFVAAEVPQSREFAVPPINPTFDIAITIGPNVVIAPPTMSLTVTGDGSLEGSLASPVVAVNLNIEEGSLRLATARLTVTPGGKLSVSYSPPEPPTILVDMEAKTSVTAMNSFGERERYVITVAATGPVSNLSIDLSSSPAGLTKEEMLAALGHVSGIFAAAETGLQNELGNILTAVGTSTIFAPVENLFVQEFGFEQFSLEYSLRQPLAIYASRRLWGNLFISYYGVLTSNFTSPNDVAYLLGLGYRFNRSYQLTVFVDNMQTGSFQLQYQNAFW